jgi:hypothetical protein
MPHRLLNGRLLDFQHSKGPSVPFMILQKIQAAILAIVGVEADSLYVSSGEILTAEIHEDACGGALLEIKCGAKAVPLSYTTCPVPRRPLLFVKPLSSLAARRLEFYKSGGYLVDIQN